ncbi:hypothetical protein Acr_00g0009190 [Actinidia rufa]|uniref:Uncharacterized protein n=1 Tax=Actinidia rufa TaxID=165716 RepID=A0A7J0D8U5_9ERIC|nr:hypothetical protein Acr_00g0009190 [Actinidia rufa]
MEPKTLPLPRGLLLALSMPLLLQPTSAFPPAARTPTGYGKGTPIDPISVGNPEPLVADAAADLVATAGAGAIPLSYRPPVQKRSSFNYHLVKKNHQDHPVNNHTHQVGENGWVSLRYGDVLPTKPEEHGWVNYLPIDKVVGASSRETRRETPHAPKTPRDKGAKLLDDAHRTARATYRPNLVRLLARGADSRDMLNAKQSREGPNKGRHLEIPNSILPRHRGNGSTKEVHTANVHAIRWEVRLKIPCEPRQTNDGPLKSHGCPDVPSISIELRRSRVEMVQQTTCTVNRKASYWKGPFKSGKESSIDHESQVRQGINVVFKELIYKLFTRIRDKAYFKKLNPWEETLKSATNNGNVPSTRKRDTTENCLALKIFLDQLVRDGHLKGFVDQENMRVEEAETNERDSFDLIKKPRHTVFESGSITFTKADLERVQHPHTDPLVIQLRMNNYDVKRILVDTRSSVEVMYYDLFKQLKLPQSDLKPSRASLVRFNAQSL